MLNRAPLSRAGHAHGRPQITPFGAAQAAMPPPLVAAHIRRLSEALHVYAVPDQDVCGIDA